MRYITRAILLSSISLFIFSFTVWQPNFETAKKLAKEKHHRILLVFSGSDWCVPCIRMHEEIFNNAIFQRFADTTLEMVNADFPRNKKNQLGAKTVKENETLADMYDQQGKFPYTLLLDENGKLIKAWDGYVLGGAESFVAEIKKYCDAGK